MVSTRIAAVPPLLNPDFKDDYTVGWICTLDIEVTASKAMLDKIHTSLPSHPNHPNHQISYILGRIGTLNVVITRLSPGLYGPAAEAAVSQMLRTFRSIRLGLVVGLGGGVPSGESDVRLGDIVVGKPTKRFGGVLHWDLGRSDGHGDFHYARILAKPLQLFLAATAKLQVNHLMGDCQIPTHLLKAFAKYPHMSNYTFPGQEHDLLFNAEYTHVEIGTCDLKEQVIRPSRQTNDPVVYYGLIGAGNLVMKSGSARDQMASKHGMLCFDMVAANLGEHFPFLEICGISDYADSHKNKRWQQYAAATAAAYAKEIISVIPENVAEKVPTVISVLGEW